MCNKLDHQVFELLERMDLLWHTAAELKPSRVHLYSTIQREVIQSALHKTLETSKAEIKHSIIQQVSGILIYKYGEQ